MPNAGAVPVSAPTPPTATLGGDVVPYGAWLTVNVSALTWAFNVMQHYRHTLCGWRIQINRRLASERRAIPLQVARPAPEWVSQHTS